MSTDEEIDYSDSPTSEPGLLEALYPVSHAAAEERGYARAIADLRARADQLVACDAEYARSYADYLESIAPGRTTP